jgi:hypothetical protein
VVEFATERRHKTMKPLFYALLVKDPSGNYEFAGAFLSREIAERRGAAMGKPYKVESANL